MEEFENLGLNSSPELVPCSICGRTFRPETLQRHQTICEKMQVKKRKVYDSSKKRAEGTEIKLPPKGKENKVEKTKSNWREKHEEFVKSIRAAKGDPEPLLEKDDDSESLGSKQVKVPAGYVQCSACGRNFNERAADRHIQWCKEQKSRISRSPASAEAVERLKARTKYRAPKLKKESAHPAKPRMQKKAPKEKHEEMASHKSARSSANSMNSSESVKKSQTTNTRVQKPKQPERKNVPMRKVNITVSNQQPANNANKTHHPVIKFKEKFPNHKPSYMMSGDNYDNYQDLLRTNNQLISKTPRTVPGVRTGGQGINGLDSVNNWTNMKSNENDPNNINLHLRFDELLGNQKNGNNKTTNWTKTSNTWQGNGLPEVSSSDSPSQLGKWENGGDARISTGSSSSNSDGSLPPISRGNSSDGRVPRCHQCHTRYPVSKAKYCYECGAKRLAAIVA